MVRLGLQLTLRSGREALVRALMIAVAVAIGVTVLLAVLADYHAYEVTSNRACWECTGTLAKTSSSRSELWNYSENIYEGRFIEVLDVAALGPKAPVVPGLVKLPGAGQYYASPELADLIKSVPADELGDRFPGSEVGTIGYQALSGPNELVAIVGYPTARLAAMPGTITVDHIATAPDIEGTTGIYREAFWVGAIMVLFPLFILVNTATRLAAARREERFAAMRLVGATGRQVNAVAAVESAVSAAFGTLLGTVAFLAVRPALAQISFSGARFFERTVTPTAAGYLAMLIAVPVVATLSSLWALRRVRVSPLGVSRKVTPPPPRAWRVLPLVVGIAVFIVPLLGGYRRLDNAKTSPTTPLLYLGAFLIMAGLVLGGPWLTMQAARALAGISRGASALLASRRLADNPKAAFRSVSGLVLAVFVGSLLASIVPVLNAAQTSLGGNARSLAHVLRVPYNAGAGPGLAPREAAKIVDELQANPGVMVLAIYAGPSFQPGAPPPPPPGPGSGNTEQHRLFAGNGRFDSIVSCAGLNAFPSLGHCLPGVRYVQANITNDLLTDNPLTIDLPVVNASNPVSQVGTKGLYLGALLVKTANAATLERARTLLTLFDAKVVAHGGLTDWQMGNAEAETFGEIAQIRDNDDTNAENVILAIVGLTLLMAACSLAVTVGGGILERRRPFTLLRLSGTSGQTLYRVVVLESVLPLLSASLVAAATGIGVAIPLVKALPKLQNEPNLALPGLAYYVALGAGLVIALLVISSSLPLLRRVTQPNNARFE
ncbi:MAG TPA: FtsX-like permease family protein [Acidimicrobiales bacterium]|nr:FtsX-like permease family protein [Acidimicrobiales bacterium]